MEAIFKSVSGGMSEEELLILSGDDGLKGLKAYPYWPAEIYGMGKYLREYGFYPAHLPLYVMTDHSPTLREDITFDLSFNAPVQLYHSPKLAENWKKVSEKPVYVMPSPFVFYRRKNKVNQAANAKGTLVFPTHNSHHLKDKSDIEAYIQQLLNLPDEFHPISACIYFLDVLGGKHKIFQKYNIPVYTAGNWLDHRFVERFYSILKNFKYTTSNLPGSYLFYSVEMGIPFSLFGNKPFLINESDTSIPLGDYSDSWKWPRVQQVVKLFAGVHKEISDEQREMVEVSLGLRHGVSRLQMSKILYSSYIKSDPYFKTGTPLKLRKGFYRLRKLFQ